MEQISRLCTDIVRNLAEASLAFIFAVCLFASPAHCIASVAREMLYHLVHLRNWILENP